MMLIAVISFLIYYYIRVTIFESIVQELNYEAKAIAENTQKFNPENSSKFKIQLPNQTQTVVEIVSHEPIKKPYFTLRKVGDKSFMSLTHQYRLSTNSYMTLTKETTLQSDIVEQIFIDILIVNVAAISLVLFYALFISRMLLLPIKTLAARLTDLDEKFLKEIDIKSLPDEFFPLGVSINKLISRIQTFVLYQKELFVGVAHELKTPLAVMKTKNEVTLLKPRESEKYIEALRSNNEAINGMNAMISSVLEIGRQEGSQFEEPVMIDVIGFLNKLGNNFAVLARQEGKDIQMALEPKILNLKIQTALLTHVVQNFVQNAVKFSPKGAMIKITSELDGENFVVRVIDEGCGIDESKDLFAPFKRFGDKGGAGLGLFLAKGAAQALGASVSIKNRMDGVSGAISSLVMPIRAKNK